MCLCIQLIAMFRIFPSSKSRHSFVANYTSVVIFEKHILVLFCCIIIPPYVCESKYLNVSCLVKIIIFSHMTHFMKVYFHINQYLFTAYFRKMISFEMHFYQTFDFSMFSNIY